MKYGGGSIVLRFTIGHLVASLPNPFFSWLLAFGGWIFECPGLNYSFSFLVKDLIVFYRVFNICDFHNQTLFHRTLSCTL